MVVDAPLTIKLFTPTAWCAVEFESAVIADIAAADAWAAAEGRQRLEYAGVSTLADLGTFDMLLVHAYCGGSTTVFTAAQATAVSTALANGTLKKLMVW